MTKELKILHSTREVVGSESERTRRSVLGILLAVSVMTHWQWFLVTPTFLGGDGQGFPEPAFSHIPSSLSTWWSLTGLGAPNVQLYQFPMYHVWGLLGALHVGFSSAQSLTILIPTALLSFFAPYYLARHLDFSYVESMAAGLFYGLSTPVLVMESSEPFLMLAVTVLPLALAFLVRAIRYHSVVSAVLTSAFLSLVGYMDVRVEVVALGTCAVILAASVPEVRNRSMVRPALAAIATWVVLNFFWVVSFAWSTSSAVGSLTSRGVFGDAFTNFSHAVTLVHGSWKYGQVFPFILSPIPLLAYSVPLVLVLGIASAIRRHQLRSMSERVMLFAVAPLAVVMIVLSTQDNPPFGHLFSWLYNHVPVMNLYRTANIFLVAGAILVSLLTAVTVRRLQMPEASSRVTMVTLVVVVFLSGWLVQSGVLTVSRGNLMFTRSVAPKGNQELGNLLARDSTYSRLLWLPSIPLWSQYSPTHPAVSASDLVTSGGPLYNASTLSNPNFGDVLTTALSSVSGRHVLGNYRFGYLVIPPESTGNQASPFSGVGLSRSDFIVWARKQPWLVAVHGSFGGYRIFRVHLATSTPAMHEHGQGSFSYRIISSTPVSTISLGVPFSSSWSMSASGLRSACPLLPATPACHQTPATVAAPSMTLSSGVGGMATLVVRATTKDPVALDLTLSQPHDTFVVVGSDVSTLLWFVVVGGGLWVLLFGGRRPRESQT